MSKQMLISKTINESRAVLMDGGEIVDFVIDRTGGSSTASAKLGSVYKGIVTRILPGMQSAFIDIGLSKAAFLYVDDAYLPTVDEQREMMVKKKEEISKRQIVGELIPDELSTLSETMDTKFRPQVPIESFLKEGQEIVVQVSKEPISTKGPRVTRHVTLPGRNIVYMPHIEHVGVSRRIEDEKERDRLKDVLESIRPDGIGVIARTVAEGQSYKVLKSDFNMLVKIWKDLSKKIEEKKAPCLAYKDLGFVQRVIRDIADEDIDNILVDNKDMHKDADKFITKFLPSMKGKVKYYSEEVPLFEQYGVEMELERGLSNKVFLRSGGAIIVDQTEALVAIDVNTGKFVGRKNLEETIVKTNLEAVKEIAYQLRLRNCGGIIIIDFIDMEKLENRKQVYETLVEALKKDRAKTNVLPISPLGLIEMTRKRTSDTLTRVMCEPCTYCEGMGRIKSKESICYEIIRELIKALSKSSSEKISLFAHPEVTAKLCGDMEVVESLEEQFSKQITVRSENSYHQEQYEIYAPDL